MIHEATGLRAACFLLVLAVMAAAERLFPRRTPTAPRGARWWSNLALMVSGAWLTRLLLPAAAVGAAVWSEERRFGLLHHVLWPYPVKAVLGVVALDLVVYFQHRLFHAVPWLWRLHAVHHTDLDLDASSGVRFHPFETFLSMLIKMAAVALLGVHFLAVTLFEILLNATALFNHANFALPFDSVLRLLVVTPDMHRVHHSAQPDERNTNFGFALPWWDRLFGTYRESPRGNHEDLLLGLAEARDPEALGPVELLARPFQEAA